MLKFYHVRSARKLVLCRTEERTSGNNSATESTTSHYSLTHTWPLCGISLYIVGDPIERLRFRFALVCNPIAYESSIHRNQAAPSQTLCHLVIVWLSPVVTYASRHGVDRSSSARSSHWCSPSPSSLSIEPRTSLVEHADDNAQTRFCTRYHFQILPNRFPCKLTLCF